MLDIFRVHGARATDDSEAFARSHDTSPEDNGMDERSCACACHVVPIVPVVHVCLLTTGEHLSWWSHMCAMCVFASSFADVSYMMRLVFSSLEVTQLKGPETCSAERYCVKRGRGSCSWRGAGSLHSTLDCLALRMSPGILSA